MDSKMKLSWEGLGVILANLGGLGGHFRVILVVLAALEGLLERFGLVLGRLEGILDGLGGILIDFRGQHSLKLPFKIDSKPIQNPCPNRSQN